MPSGGRLAEKASPKLPAGWCIDPKNGRYWCEKELSPGGTIPPGVDGEDDGPLGSCLAEEDGFEEEDDAPAEDLDERLLRRHPPPTGTLRSEPPRVQ
jgi:hypothetical protein